MIEEVINIYILIIIADVILSYFPKFKSESWAKQIRKLSDYTLKPVRGWLPDELPFDIAPIIVIFLLNLVKPIL